METGQEPSAASFMASILHADPYGCTASNIGVMHSGLIERDFSFHRTADSMQ